ncbi:structure-specific endonuclease subunit SLX4 [Erythrolamprus reginae]|uniref:structure-specific endonuclease subunit SLX4 n=1 Tax=Erythrolamprus reginae TaxID=121349 RepID=UPI00396C7EDA
MGRPGCNRRSCNVSDKMQNKNRQWLLLLFLCGTLQSGRFGALATAGAVRPPGGRGSSRASGRRSLRCCAAKMADSEDEFRRRDTPGRLRGVDTGAAPAAGPPPLPRERGLKRGGAPRPARRGREGAAGQPRRGPGTSCSEAGGGGKRPRAETRGRARPPPPLLLQGPEEARRGLEARAASLLSEAPAAPRTPPLPASRWNGSAAGASQTGRLWELSSLTGAPAAVPGGAGQGKRGSGEPPAGQRPEVPGPPAEPPETERSPRRASERCEGGSPREADAALQDLLELAGEGLTFTQWSLDVGRLRPPEQEETPGVQPKPFTQLLEKQQQQQRQLSQKCSCETFPLGSLAAAFKEMVNNPHLSDIQIQVDSGEVFYAHMFVLYARCPQLLQFVDHRRFVVAEEGDLGATRVLLHDTPGDAVALFLKYLYTAEHFAPQHLLSDVIDLAVRFGVKELAVLCEGQTSEEASVEKPAEDEEDAEDFEELLKSMWQEEDEETVAKAVCRDEISDSMNEQELEEIYEFAATQRRVTPDEARKERVHVEHAGDKVEKEMGQDGGSCPRKVLEKPRSGLTVKGRETKSNGESSKLKISIGSMGKDLKKSDFKKVVSFEANSRKEPTSEIPPRLAGDSTQRNHLEETSATQLSVPEMERCSVWEQNTNVAKDETTARDFPRLFQVPTKDLQITFPTDLEVPFSPITSASQPNILDRLPSQNDKQQNINRKAEASVGSLEKPGALNPQGLNITGDHIIVLDSDEEQEAEKKPAEEAPSSSEQWHKESPAPPQQDVSKAGDGLGTLICNEAQSLGECHQPLDLSGPKEGSSWEGLGWSEGRTLVVPETPLVAWNHLDDNVQVEEPRLNSSLEEEWTHETRPETSSCSYKLLPVFSPPSLLRAGQPEHGPCAAAEGDVVVVVDDSEEEQEAVPLCPRETFSGPLEAIAAKARNPVIVASSVTNSAAPSHFGVGDLLLHNSQNWPGEDSDGSEALPACSRLSASTPVPKMSELACQARDISCVAPLMPLPPYSSMDTPELRKELSRFGVRALPKQQMVLKLKEIFQFTQQGAGTDLKKKSMPASSSSFQKLQQRCLSPCRLLQGSPNTADGRDLSEGGARRPGAELGWPKGAALPANRSVDGEDSEDLGTTTSEEPASQSSPVEFEVSMLAEREENVPASPISANDEGQKLEILKRYIHSNPSLCQQILLYKPIELSVLHSELKQNGIRIALDKLLDFLDANCITFTTAEARREKKRHPYRCKKKVQR